MQIEVLNYRRSKDRQNVDLPEDIFGIEPNNHVVYLAVKAYLAAQRTGTHKVKTRAEVQGASRKLHKQKELVELVRVISVTLCTKVVVLFLAQNHTAMILS